MSTDAAPTITEFLLARIAEDEEAATKPVTDLPITRIHHPRAITDVPSHPGATIETPAHDRLEAQSVAATYSADPARVLRECAAKRSIVALHRGEKWNIPPVPDPDGAEYVHTHDGIEMRFGGASWLITFDEYATRLGATLLPPASELRHLAAIYSDHPDYQQKWAF